MSKHMQDRIAAEMAGGEYLTAQVIGHRLRVAAGTVRVNLNLMLTDGQVRRIRPPVGSTSLPDKWQRVSHDHIL